MWYAARGPSGSHSHLALLICIHRFRFLGQPASDAVLMEVVHLACQARNATCRPASLEFRGVHGMIHSVSGGPQMPHLGDSPLLRAGGKNIAGGYLPP